MCFPFVRHSFSHSFISLERHATHTLYIWCTNANHLSPKLIYRQNAIALHANIGLSNFIERERLAPHTFHNSSWINHSAAFRLNRAIPRRFRCITWNDVVHEFFGFLINSTDMRVPFIFKSWTKLKNIHISAHIKWQFKYRYLCMNIFLLSRIFQSPPKMWWNSVFLIHTHLGAFELFEDMIYFGQ